jgi:hypothetical protein
MPVRRTVRMALPLHISRAVQVDRLAPSGPAALRDGTIMRQAPTAGSPGPAPGAAAQQPGPGQAPSAKSGAGQDQDELIEHVLRALMERLADEAERHGVTPWD